MNEAPAWLINIGEGRTVGTGALELLHLVEQPELFEVPFAPPHCKRVLLWQGQLLPVWEIAAWLNHDSTTDKIPLIAIVGYQLRRGDMPKFGAIALSEPPVRTRVSDSQGCELPADQAGWSQIALTAFLHEGQPVPVLNLTRMFSRLLAPSDL